MKKGWPNQGKQAMRETSGSVQLGPYNSAYCVMELENYRDH